MRIVSKILGAFVKTKKAVPAQVVERTEKAINSTFQKAQEAFGGTLKGVRNDIAIYNCGSQTVFARLGNDGLFHTLKSKQICKPAITEDGRLWRRRLDYSFTNTLNGENVRKTICNDRLYSKGGRRLLLKDRRVWYDAQNAINGHYIHRLPVGSHAQYDIANGKYFKNIKATDRSGRMAGEVGTLAYLNGRLSTIRTDLWSYNPALKVDDDIRRMVGTAGFLNPKFM